MHRWLRFKHQMGHRLRAYFHQYPDSAPHISNRVDELDRLLDEARTLEQEWVRARQAGRAATERRRELRIDIREYHLVPIVATLRVAATKEPGSITRWPLPRFRADDRTFATTARGAAEEAIRARELLRRHGLPTEVADEMLQLLAEWEAAGVRQIEAMSRRVAARAGLQATAERLLELGRWLDAVHRSALARHPDRQAAWQSARHIPWPG